MKLQVTFMLCSFLGWFLIGLAIASTEKLPFWIAIPYTLMALLAMIGGLVTWIALLK